MLKILRNGAKKHILGGFFRGFSATPSHALCVTPKFFAKWKVSWRQVSVVSFMSMAFVIAKLWMFKCFRSRKNYICRLLLGGFSYIAALNQFQFVQNFTSDAVQGNVSQMLKFLIQFWKFQEINPKTHFWARFQKFFSHALLQPTCDAPIFCQIKGLMKIHNRGKFHWRSVCGSQVMNFQMFS